MAAVPDRVDDRSLGRALSGFRTASNARGVVELAITAVPLCALWTAAILLVGAGKTIGLVLTVPAGLFLLRLFLIQHDCGHGAFFASKKANDWVGRALGVVTLTPYDDWRHSHALHHATTGNLDRRGFGDIDTLTVAEYRALPAARRRRYRMYRNPLVLFGIGPAYQFLVRHRVPAIPRGRGWRPWAAVMATNAAIVAAAGAAITGFGLAPFLLVHLPVTLVAATVGIWLFYVQHQFPGTIWMRDADWSVRVSSLHGSSHYDLPAPLRWFTANIGAHHVHHLCSTIPFYRIGDAMRAVPHLAELGRIGVRDSLATVRLTLWDEAAARMVSFREVRRA